MSYASEHPFHCLHPGCPATGSGSRWGKIKASSEGWFFPRDQDGGWCPSHRPEWVERWRKKRDAGKLR